MISPPGVVEYLGMVERAYAGRERLKARTSPAQRLEGVLRLAAPDFSPVARFMRIRSSSPEPILKYPHSGNITIAADYGLRSFKGIKIPGFGLKVAGEEMVYATAREIETVLERNGLKYTGTEEAQQNEALFLHGILVHGEANRTLPSRNARQIEDLIAQANSERAQTVAELDGKARVYFPFVPQEASSQGAKMIQVVTEKTGEDMKSRFWRDAEITRAHELVNHSTVRKALDRIADHAVTLEEMLYGGVTYVQITDSKGAMHVVNTVTGAEFTKTIDVDGQEHITHELLSEELTREILSGKKIMMVFGASGANAKNFSVGWREQSQDLIIAGEGTQMDKMTANGVRHELQFNRENQSDHDRLTRLLESGLVFAVYDSTDVKFRIPNLNRVVPHLQSGKIERYVTTKPVARSLNDLLEMRRILRQADSNGRPLEERFFIHEHYLAKGPLRAFLAHAKEVVDALGIPTQLEISIQEERTAEHDSGDENRVKSLPDGLMQDLAPHAASISILMQQLISTMGYDVSLRGKPIDDIPMLTKLRYTPTDFETYTYLDPDTNKPKDVPIDTGFAVEGHTTIVKKADANQSESSEQHDLRFSWVGGKGLRNDKQVTITFNHPVTGIESKVTIDLNGNITKPVAAPESVQHLFKDLEGKPQDNGYGGITAAALLSDQPAGRFQSFHDASVVWIMEHRLKELSNGTSPYAYSSENRPPTEEIIRRARQARRGQGTETTESEEKLARVS